MGGLTIYKDSYVDATAVSNIFIDEYMKDANDAQLKIYIYLIRMMNANLSTSVSDIADKFNHTEKDVLRALKYWEKNRLLSLEYDESRNLIGIHLLDLNKPGNPAGHQEEKQLAPVVSLLSKPLPEESSSSNIKEPAADPYEKPSYSLDRLKEFKASEETSQLLFITEQYIGRTLTPTEIKTILFISDRLAFSSDLIDYLVQYCVEHGKKDFRYIEKVAISWAQAGISTAKEAARYARKYDKAVYAVMKDLGKTNAPTDKEAAYITHWTKEYGFGMDVIETACERTVMATEKHRFEYADSILTSWYKFGVQHKSDIAKADEGYQKAKNTQAPPKTVSTNKFNQFTQNNYDFDALEKELLRK